MSNENSLAVERKATPNTALLIPSWRRKTGLQSGTVLAKDALTQSNFEVVDDNRVSLSKMKLADETPFYEIAFGGQVYRMLSRPRALEAVPKHAGQWPRDSDLYELVRTVAPGLRQDGTYLAAPDAVPNTPRSLISELVTVTGATIAELLTDAYSIFHYRLDHVGAFPDTMKPAGYRLDSLLLATAMPDGNLRTLYETPDGPTAELWTIALQAVDTQLLDRLASYAASSMARTEFREQGVAALKEALLLRGAETGEFASLGFKRFTEIFFPATYMYPDRRVGRNANEFNP